MYDVTNNDNIIYRYRYIRLNKIQHTTVGFFIHGFQFMVNAVRRHIISYLNNVDINLGFFIQKFLMVTKNLYGVHVAQWVEHRFSNSKVLGSTPRMGTPFFVSLGKTLYLHYFCSPRSKMGTWLDSD